MAENSITDLTEKTSEPFFLMRPKPASSEITGSTNLLRHHKLLRSHRKLCKHGIKDKLSAFLPKLSKRLRLAEDIIDRPASEDGSSLRDLVMNPPNTSIEIRPLTPMQLESFQLEPHRPVPVELQMDNLPKKKDKKKKDKSHKKKSHKKKSHKKKNKKAKKDKHWYLEFIFDIVFCSVFSFHFSSFISVLISNFLCTF